MDNEFLWTLFFQNSPKKCLQNYTQKAQFSWIHQKCPQEFTYFFHKYAPFMSTKSPLKTPQSNGLYLVMVVQLQLLSNHVLCMSKETLLTDGWPDRNSLAYFFFYYSFMMSWFLSQKWLEVTILRSRGFNAP